MRISARTVGRGAVLSALLLCVAGAVEGLWAQTPPAGALDEIALDYQTAFGAWLGRILAVTTDLFFWLALIEFAIAGILFAIASPTERAGETGRLLIKIMLLSFIYVLITESQRWLLPLVSSFAEVGQYVTGETLSPSEIVDYGVELSGIILKSVDPLGMITNLPIVIYMTLAAFLVLICYVMIATQVVVTLVHSYLLLSAGLFFLAFAAFRATASFAENLLMACVHVGIKLMVLYFVVGVGEPLTRSWAASLRNDTILSSDFTPILHVLAGVFIFAFIAWFIPNKVAGQITGGASFGLASAMRRTS